MTLPWIVLTFLLFFVGMFVLVYFSMRNQDKSLEQIMQQQKVLRMEFERLADALDELLEKHEVEDRDFDQRKENNLENKKVNKPAPELNSPAKTQASALGMERLLLGPEKKQATPAPVFAPSAPSSPSFSGSGNNTRAGGMPDLKL